MALVGRRADEAELAGGGILVTYRVQHRFYAVGACVLLASQMVGYIIKCCGV